eukprot:gene52581-58290_t
MAQQYPNILNAPIVANVPINSNRDECPQAHAPGRVLIGNLRTGRGDDAEGGETEDVRCDRTSLLGNPFRMQGRRTGASEKASCDAYAEYLDAVAVACDGDRDVPITALCRGVAARHGLAPWRDPSSARYECPFLASATPPRIVHGVAAGTAAVAAELRRLRATVRAGRSLRLLCHCWPERCHTMEIRRWLGGPAAGA